MTLKDRKAKKLKTLVDSAIVVIRKKGYGISAPQLAEALTVDVSKANEVITQLQKDEFLHSGHVGRYEEDPVSRANFYHMRKK